MRGNYFRKLLLACLLVVFFCGCVTAIYTYVDRMHATEAEWKRNHLRLLEQVRDNGDLKLAAAMNAIFNLRVRPELIEYARSDGRDPYINTKALQTLGSYVDVYLSTGYKIDMFKTDADIVISKDHTHDLTRYLNERGLHQEGMLQEMEEGSEKKYLSIFNLEKWRIRQEPAGEVYLAVVINDTRYNKLAFLVTLQIDELFPKELENHERFTIAIDHDLFAEISAASFSPSERLERFELPSQTFPNWTYSYEVRMPSLGNIGVLQTVVIALLTIVAGAIFAILIAFRTYSPVRQLVRQVKELVPEKSNRLEPKDEFQVFHHIAKTIHQENQKLTDQLDEYRQPVREKLLRDLTTGMLARDEARHLLEAQKLDHLINRPLSVAIFQEYDEMGLTLIDHSVVEGIEHIVRRYSPTAEFIRMDNNRQVILLFHSDDGDPTATLQKIINDVHENYPIRLTVSTGISAGGVLDAVRSYHSAVRVLEQLRPLSRKSLLTVADLEEGTSHEYYYPLDLERELIQSTLAQSENEVIHIIDSLLRGTSFTVMDSAAYFQFTYSIHSTLHRIAQQLNCQLVDLFDEPPFQILQQCNSLEAVRLTLLDMFRKLMELAGEKSKRVDQELADSLTQFIYEHYDQDISLTDLAQHIKLSPSYISTLFKMYHGVSFRDYLNNYRVEQAKQLMERGERKVADISAKVGCNNVNTFIRIFKKVEGISPGQYIAQRYLESEQ